MKKLILISGALIGSAMTAVVVFAIRLSAPGHKGPVTEHFDGKKFRNPVPTEQGIGDFLRWRLSRKPGPWTEERNAPPGPKPKPSVEDGALRVTFINHATTLIQLDGLNILTDPVWSDRVSPVAFAGPKRFRPPGIRFEDLPPIGLVIISHNHYDHMDLPTLQRLAADHRPKFVVQLGNAVYLERAGITNVEELDWWQTTAAGAVGVRSVPSQHFAARGMLDRDRTLWGGYLLESKSGNVYFAGDTGWGPHFEAIGRRFPPIRLALLPIGAYLPRWFMKGAHINPEEALRAHGVLRAKRSLAIHFGTFALGDDGEDEPVADLRKALAAGSTPAGEFLILDEGEAADIPPC